MLLEAFIKTNKYITLERIQVDVSQPNFAGMGSRILPLGTLLDLVGDGSKSSGYLFFKTRGIDGIIKVDKLHITTDNILRCVECYTKVKGKTVADTPCNKGSKVYVVGQQDNYIKAYYITDSKAEKLLIPFEYASKCLTLADTKIDLHKEHNPTYVANLSNKKVDKTFNKNTSKRR